MEFFDGLVQWFNIADIRKQRSFLEEHLELLVPQDDDILRSHLLREHTDPGNSQSIQEALLLLQDARGRGGNVTAVQEAYVNVKGGFALDIPSWLIEVEQELLVLQDTKRPDLTAEKRIILMCEAISKAQNDNSVAPETVASLYYEQALALFQCERSDRTKNLEDAIANYNASLQMFTLSYYPYQYALIKQALGDTYAKRIIGSKFDNWERALGCYQEAAAVFVTDYFYEYIEILRKLCAAYTNRLNGKRKDNVEQAIYYGKLALQNIKREGFLFEYAQILYALGYAYYSRIEGEQRENLEQALNYYSEALHILTFEAYPVEYAVLQMDLGTAYNIRIEGEQKENKESAIRCYEESLRIYTFHDFPRFYARVMLNLGRVYRGRIKGESRKNLEAAIACYQEALRVCTPTFLASDYAMTQNNLGIAYFHYGEVKRENNLGQVIACFLNALRVWTMDTYPYDYAMVQQNLGEVPYNSTIVARDQESIERTLAHYQEALRIWTLDAYPHEHRRMQLAVADVEVHRQNWEAAHIAYEAALDAEELLVALGVGTKGKDAILQEGQKAATNDSFSLAQLGRFEEAVLAVERGRVRSLAEAVAFNIADPQLIQDKVRRARYMDVRERWIDAQKALHVPLSSELDEDARRRDNLERTELYKEAKAAFDVAVADIRAAQDPANFLYDPLESMTIRQTFDHLGPAHAFVYLLATPWGGMALIVQNGQPGLQEHTHFDVLHLPMLTDDFLENLVEVRAKGDHKRIIGGFAVAQQGNTFALLQQWPGETIREKAEALHSSMAHIVRPATLDSALQEILILPALAHLVEQSPDSLSEENHALFANTLDYVVLKHELNYCFEQFRTEIMHPLVTWLREKEVHSLTLIPCGYLAAFPLGVLPIDDEHTLNEMFPTSIVPSVRVLLHDSKRDTRRTGISALGNPYPTHQELKWGEAETSTIVSLGKQLGLPSLERKQRKATKSALIEALRTSQVVSVSCHGIFDTHDILRSRLLLANRELLTLADILSYQVDLRGLRLLVLSACQTALLDLRGAREEVRSLATGMLHGGARAVLAALWSVDDRATYLLMVRFAQEWFPRMSHEPPNRALARAQQWLRKATNRELQEWQAAIVPPSLPEEQDGFVTPKTDLVTNVTEQLSPRKERFAVTRGRGLRYSMEHAQDLVQSQAEKGKLDDCPYSHPYYWAGFQMYGW